MNDKTRILFVCLGNIIRSPLAEHMFAHLAEKAGVADKYFVDSAGTSAYHIGEQPDSRMRRVAAQNGLQYDGRAKQFQEDDYDRFDFIIPQDQDNLRNLRWLARGPADEAKLFTMRTFDPLGSSNDGVPDPYYGGADGFQTTFEIVRRSCQGLLDALEKGELA
ncbi:MAG: low molecular weight phosphotyrosine protein phosphatase [Anaerolineales bacterium]|jgi:protein-tyrosine phosphatase